MLPSKPSTIDFDSITIPSANPNKIDSKTIKEYEINDAPPKEKTAMAARLMMSPKSKAAAIKASGIGRKKKVSMSHLSKGQKPDNSDSWVNAGAKLLGFGPKYTTAI